jgi:acid phosphatase family membrane protein YuiD
MPEDSPELRSHPVTYDLDDLLALSKLTPRSAVQVFRLVAGAVVLLFALIMVVEVWSLTGIIDWMAITTFLFVGVIVLVLSSRRVRAQFWLRVMRLGALHSAHSYAVTPSALRISSSKGVFDARWTAFTDVKRTADRLFAFMNHRQAYVVPRRAFDSDEQFDAFATSAVQCWEQSHRL